MERPSRWPWFILRDPVGFVHEGGLNFQYDVANSMWAEALAFMQSMTWAKDNNFANIVIERDCVTIINRINSSSNNVTLIEYLLH